MNVVIVKESEDRLESETWRYWVRVESYSHIAVTLDSYSKENRPTTRHKYRAIPGNYYSRLDRRKRTMELSDVPEPVDKEARVREGILAKVRFVELDS